jgi:four helix bundle protein
MSEELRVQKPDIAERSFRYSLRIVKLYRELQKDGTGRVLGKQLLRAGTSIGANVHEAQAGQSRADFIAKMSIAHKEARETIYWLRLIRESGLVPPARLTDLYNETDQLIRILSAILLSTKTGARRRSETLNS